MGLLDKLIEAPGLGGAVAGGHEARTLDVSGASDSQVLGTLVTTFGSDEECAEIRVLRDGGLLGVVRREAALGVVGEGQKGWGSSDPMWLPGVANYSTTSWSCPLGPPHYSVTLIVLGDTPTCPHHPGQKLVLDA
jgi:hypothetical protein